MSLAKGYAAHKSGEPLKPFEFKRRECGPNDVAIEILFCGVCHSDLHSVNGDWGVRSFPLVPGHEIVGKVTAVGENVKKFKTGDNVGVGCFVDSCQKCESCKENLEQYCEGGVTATYGSPDKAIGGVTQGGYSTKIIVTENFVLKIPDGIPLDAAAPLLCAG
ncbi:MAG: alcohol dehydrogenase catalytic domain-containing protein, partial [Bdellovibrionota bacterium]